MRGVLRSARYLAVVVAVVVALPAAARAQQKPIPFSDAAVEKAIKDAKKFLWSQYDKKLGHWTEPALPADLRQKSYHGGYSSLAMYALLSAGERHQERRMKHALKWLAKVPMNATYCLGIRAQVWLLLPRKQGRALLKKDYEQLRDSISRPDKPPVDFEKFPAYGTYGYVANGKPAGGDHSNTQFGILGVWAAARQNIEVPQWYWKLVYKHFEAVQNRDGGWGYGYAYGGVAEGGSRATMTAAGLASMFVAFDNIHSRKFVKCGANPVVKPLQRGLNWFDKHYSPSASFGGGPYYYYLYGVERIGLASGYKYFGKKDWYKLGATRLINTQRGGGWGNVVTTSFALLFLVRGRAPVLFNRLEYDGEWNNRPRALANLTRWTSHKFEREVNWQIINLQTEVEEWHDAPILLISGARKPTFTPKDLDKLREFVWQGGMILSVAECRTKGRVFDRAMRGPKGVYSKLFPNYELKRLPNDHPIYTAHFRLKRRIPLRAISNGVRILAMHTDEDLLLPWQTNAVATGKDAFELAFNLVFYATDRALLRHRGTTPWPRAKPIVPLRVARVARVKYKGNWAPEPLAWRRFGILMAQHWQTKLLHEVVAAEKLDAKTHRVAAMTGTGEFSLAKPQKQALKRYVEGGGTLILDAAGGSEGFSRSATALLKELFGEGSVRRLPSFSPVYQMSGLEVKSVRYRRAARRIGRGKDPRIMGITLKGRVAVFFSREDLTSGLVGVPCYSCIGYAPGTSEKPGSAVKLMRNMVLYGNQIRKPPAKPKAEPAGSG